MSGKRNTRASSGDGRRKPFPDKHATTKQKNLWDQLWPLIQIQPQGDTIDPDDVEEACEKMLLKLSVKDGRWTMLRKDPERKLNSLYHSLWNHI